MTRNPDGPGSPDDPPDRRPAGLTVGLGASAGGLDALERFFASFPGQSGLTFVVVQHLEPRHPSMLVDLLARRTAMQVVEAADGVRPERDHVYVIAPGTLLTLERGRFTVAATPNTSSRVPIDTLFRSLAAECGDLAVGIVFSGAGHDGTAGLRAIKERGGLTLAQAPGTARHEGMPQSAIEAGLADHVLRPEQMPATVLEHAGYVERAGRSGDDTLEAQLAEHLPVMCAAIRQHTGHDFTHYKEGTLLRRLRRRLQVLHVGAFADYLGQLERDAAEAEALVRELLVGVTQFFRDPAAFQSLSQQAVSRILLSKIADIPIRVWVVGCASGEEAYSIAMLFREQIQRAEAGSRRSVQIFATDLDSEMLAEARLGRYPLSIAEHVSPERLERFFIREADSYQVSNELREMCLFSQHSLTRDPPFSQLDLVSCRNVVIYLDATLQKKLVPLFHYALRPGGFLFLGPSEGLAGGQELFETVIKKDRLFRRKETISRPAVQFPLTSWTPPRSTVASPPAPPRTQTPRDRLAAGFERLVLEEYSWPALVVDERGEILLVAGPAARYLQLPAGTLASNLLEAVRGQLRIEVRAALQAAAQGGRRVVRDRIPVDVEDIVRFVRLVVRPMPSGDPGSTLFLVVLQEQVPAGDSEAVGAELVGPSDDPAMQQLETELRLTRAELRSTVEALEAANEELKSSNEELISTNEELQSANEELQTSKEELQSLNEELETVNAELRLKVDELGTANSDLQNLFASTDIATIFLDRQSRIVRFTPAATALFHLRESDVGRPIGELAPRFVGEDLAADCREVLRTLATVERQVRAADEPGWFILRVAPYRTVGNAIAGVVVTFVDVSALKQAEEALRRTTERERFLADVLESATTPFAVGAPDGRLLLFNRAFAELTGYSREELEDPSLSWVQDLTPPEWRDEEAEVLAEAVRRRWSVRYEKEYRRKDGTRVPIELFVQPVVAQDGSVLHYRSFLSDITERRRAEAERDRLARQLQIALDAARMGWWHYDPVTGLASFDARYTEIFGVSGSERPNEEILRLLHPDDLPRVWAAVEAALDPADPQPYSIEYRVNRPDGTTCWVEAHGAALFVGEGAARHAASFVGTVADITARKRAEESLRASEERLRLAQGVALVGTFEWDVVTGVNVWTPELEAMYGLPPGGFAATQPAWESLVHPDDRSEAMRRIEQSFATGAPTEGEWRVVWPDGTVHWLAGRWQVFKDEAGRPLRMTGINIDITGRKAAEEQLAYLASFPLKNPSPIVEADAAGRVTYANPSALREFPDISERGSSHPWLAGWESVARSVGHGGGVTRREVSVGDRTFQQVLVYTPEKGVVRVYGVEITERRRAQDALERSRHGLSQLAAASLSVMAKTDLADMLQAVAEAALALVGGRMATCGHGLVSGQLVIGGSARVPGAPVCPPGEMFVLNRGGVHMDLGESSATIRLTDRQLREHPRWWGLPEAHVPTRGLLGARMVGRNGQPCGMILVTDKEQGDFTDEDESLLAQLATVASLALQHVEARISLEEGDRRKNDFLAMLSHELRNPLAPIRSSLYVLNHTAPGSGQALRAQSIIDRQVAHLTRLVDELLDVTRISRGKIQLQTELLDLADVARRVVEDYRPAFVSGELELQVAIPEEAVWVDGDRTRLSQVIGNLLQNAQKFTSAGGAVSLSVEANSYLRQAVVRVRDTGAGIAREMLPRIFEPFTQADTTLDRSKGGLGLGLALVKGLVEMHGGTVSVSSPGLGRGAEFTVRLPIQAAPAAGVEKPAAETGQRGQGRRVLVIEDSLDGAESLRVLFELGGHTVEVAHSGVEGLEKARAFHPDVVLCDIGLPGMDGYAVARVMRREPGLQSVVLVALTGYAAAEDVAKSTAAGFDHHLAKPPSIQRLEQILSGG